VAAEPVVPIPAATVVVLREAPAGIEVLLTHRPATMAFAADMHVFPGGRVDAADGADRDAATLVGAIRELWEESGILLADSTATPGELASARAALVDGTAAFRQLAERLNLRLRTDLLHPVSRG